MASVGKRQEKQARETMKLREKDSKKQDKERDYYRKLQEEGILFSEKLFTMRGKPMRFDDFPYVKQVFQDDARIVVLLWARSMTKTTTIASILTHKLITNAYSGAMVAAPRDKQAWRVTKEHIRPRFTESKDKMLLPLISQGKNTESEIDIANGSKYLASGAWVTGNSLRGPHVNYGFADEMQDWTREAFEVFKEVVNLPPAQIFCAGTPKDKGSFFEEIWFSSDKKEWNGKEWIPTNPDADPQISGYHITQEFSSFVAPEQLEYKRKNMTPRMFTNEVLAQFFAAGGSKPVTTETLLQILVRSPGEINNSVFEEKVIGVDWGDETRWVLVGRTAKNKFYVIDTGVFDDIDTMQHVEKLRMIISRENPKWIICDAGYGKTKNQILMRHYPGRVWSAFTNSGSNIPIWNTINEINGLPLPEDDWQYHVSVNHTAMCENTEAIINRRNLGIYYFPEQAARTDVFIFEISQADAEEVSTSTGKQRRFSISSAHGYAALSYALLPYAFVQDYAEAGYNQNVMTRAPRFARRRFA
jgi:hypothetical protein